MPKRKRCDAIFIARSRNDRRYLEAPSLSGQRRYAVRLEATIKAFLHAKYFREAAPPESPSRERSSCLRRKNFTAAKQEKPTAVNDLLVTAADLVASAGAFTRERHQSGIILS